MPRRVKNVDVKYTTNDKVETHREIKQQESMLPTPSQQTDVPGLPDLSKIPGLQGLQQMPGFGNMENIISMAQKIAKDVTQDNGNSPVDPKNLDMSKILSRVTENVSKMAESPDFMNQFSSGGSQVNNDTSTKSKINLNKIEELDDSDDDDEKGNISSLAPRTKDLHFTLNVTLEELYKGKTKKLAVRRKRIIQKDDKKEIIEEKKKLTVVIEPGMFDEQVITFNKEADEKEGYETGDIIITLSCAENETFTRDGNNLILEKDISLYEVFKPEISIDFINGKTINLKATPINIFGDELESYRKLVGFGMPIMNTSNYGDLIILFKPVFPSSISDEGLEHLKNIFPPVNKINSEIEKYEQLELVTESDFELSDDSDEDSDEESDEESDEDSDEDSSDVKSDSEQE